MDATQAQIIANWINVAIAAATLAAVIVAFLALRKNDKQGKENWEHTQQLAREEREHTRQLTLEERQHQSRPILIPVGEISHHGNDLKVDWNIKAPYAQTISLQNVGNGVALEIQAVFVPRSNTWPYY